MQKEQAIVAAKPHFKTYPTVTEFHVTTDGQVFEEKHHADNHAKFLNSKEPFVHVVTADEVAALQEAENTEKKAAKKK